MMDVKLTVTKTLDDNYWGFDDMLDGLDLTDPEEINAEIINYIRDVDPWEAVDPDAGAIWTVSIDGENPDWKARAEAAENKMWEAVMQAAGEIAQWQEKLEAAEQRVAELEAQLAAQAWQPMETVPDGEDVELLVHGYIGDDGLWYYRDGTTPLKGWRPVD